MEKIAIIGSGSWGIALGIYLAKKGNNINVWSFDKEEAKEINEKKYSRYLPNVEIILHVTPSKFTRSTVKQYKQYIKDNQTIVMCSKGYEADSLLSLGEVV